MGISELLAVAVGLSMDAFSAAVCRGTGSHKRIDGFVTAVMFGSFQGIMPILGYFLGSGFADRMVNYANIIGAALLALIGIKMIAESRHDEENTEINGIFQLLGMAVATSIDATTVGLIFAANCTKPLFPSAVIGAVTFAITWAGAAIGRRFGKKYGKSAEIAGGVLLILIGVKILMSGTR